MTDLFVDDEVMVTFMDVNGHHKVRSSKLLAFDTFQAYDRRSAIHYLKIVTTGNISALQITPHHSLLVPRTIIPVTGSHRILQERNGKDPRIPKEDTGNHWNWKQYSSRKMVGFFPADSYKFPMLSDRNRPEFIGKIPKISDRNTASEKTRRITRKRPFPGRTIPHGESLTLIFWVSIVDCI